MGFAEEHRRWLDYHLKQRKGERLDRLKRGHGHGEQMFAERVWWPIFGHFDHLHPEYEVSDWRGRPYFVDFVWNPGRVKFAIEVKGYGPHVQNSDRTKYRQELNREICLQIGGYRVVAVPYDDLETTPGLTISLLRSLFMPYLTVSEEEKAHYSRLEREILQIALRTGGGIRPADLVQELQIHPRTAVKRLRSLCDKGKFQPIMVNGSSRVNRYEYIHSIADSHIW
ncbi:hypothetical protein GCM10010912_47950 [Paenibacillus albidus]|uniref:DUF559 domain-containing protein n=1 Tax=Paenibacillus albidus TaxID=2041023 RepID=A0A917CS12_9BACL|nr:hypothetical protein [Paenibacillus albidus]GGF97650.1 hypothetical protein GCM10010912_47950 [Paenibacillus albidus]